MLSLSFNRSKRSAGLPTLPTELKQHILSFADPATLAVASRASFAFLGMASELLYRDIEVDGLKTLGLLFCQRTSISPRLEPFLSLSQIKTFTFIIPLIWFNDPIPNYSWPLSRADDWQPIPVQQLSIYFDLLSDTDHRVYPHGHPKAVPDLHVQLGVAESLFRSALIPLFDPASVLLSPFSIVPNHPGIDFGWIFPYEWTRLSTVHLVQCSTIVNAHKKRTPQVEFELPFPWDYRGGPTELLKGLAKDLTWMGAYKYAPPRKATNVWVGSRENADGVRRVFEEEATKGEGKEGRWEKTKGRIEILVKDFDELERSPVRGEHHHRSTSGALSRTTAASPREEMIMQILLPVSMLYLVYRFYEHMFGRPLWADAIAALLRASG